MAARKRLRLAQHPLAGLQVIVVGPARRRRRGKDEADGPGVVLVGARKLDVVSFGVERHRVLGAVGLPLDDDTAEAVLAFEPHQVMGERIHGLDTPAFTIGDQIAPVLAARRGKRRGHDLVVFGAVGVGQDDQPVAAVVDAVHQPRHPRLDQPGFALRLRGLDDPHFAGVPGRGGDHDEAAAAGAADRNRKLQILFLVDQRIVCGIGAEAVPVDETRPQVVVLPDIVDDVAVGPGEVRHRLDDLGQIAPGRQIAHRQGEALRAAVVERIGKVPMVRAMDAGIAQREVRLALRQHVAVDAGPPRLRRRAGRGHGRDAPRRERIFANTHTDRPASARRCPAAGYALSSPQPAWRAGPRVAPAPHRHSGFRPSGRRGWPVRAATGPAPPRASSCHAAMRSYPPAQYRDCAGVPACGPRPEARCRPSSPLSVRVCSPLRRAINVGHMNDKHHQRSPRAHRRLRSGNRALYRRKGRSAVVARNRHCGTKTRLLPIPPADFETMAIRPRSRSR